MEIKTWSSSVSSEAGIFPSTTKIKETLPSGLNKTIISPPKKQKLVITHNPQYTYKQAKQASKILGLRIRFWNRTSLNSHILKGWNRSIGNAIIFVWDGGGVTAAGTRTMPFIAASLLRPWRDWDGELRVQVYAVIGLFWCGKRQRWWCSNSHQLRRYFGSFRPSVNVPPAILVVRHYFVAAPPFLSVGSSASVRFSF